MERNGRKSSEGYTLVAIVIGIAILTIAIAAVAPSIGTIMKREREEELIFRGKQYARAIALFQKHYGRFPNELKELYENHPRTIRKLWKDPMCNCDFHVLIQGTPEALISATGALPPGFQQTPGTTGPAPQATPTPGIFGPAPGGTKTIGPIAGVRSTVHKEALREWRGQKHYDEWRFIVGDADRDLIGQGLGSILGPRSPMPPTPTGN